MKYSIYSKSIWAHCHKHKKILLELDKINAEKMDCYLKGRGKRGKDGEKGEIQENDTFPVKKMSNRHKNINEPLGKKLIIQLENFVFQ